MEASPVPLQFYIGPDQTKSTPTQSKVKKKIFHFLVEKSNCAIKLLLLLVIIFFSFQKSTGQQIQKYVSVAV